MSKKVKYAYVELDDKYRYMSIAGGIYNVKDVFDSVRYRSQKEIDKINEVYYGGRIKNVQCAFCKASAPGVYHGSSIGSNEDCFADTFFSCEIDGSEGTYQTELHFFKTERGYQRIAYCSCPAFKKDNYNPCKHLEALSMHIRDHYEFDENNYTIIEPPYALEMEKGHDETSSRQNKLVNYDKLIKYIPYFDTVYLRLYEKMCRYLKDGIHSFGNYTSKWNDLPVREKFKERGMDFDSFTRDFIENTMGDRGYYYVLKCGRNDDYWWLKYDADRNREQGDPADYTLFKTFDERISNINLSTATCPMAFETINDFYRIFDSYARVTVFEYDGQRIRGKYIVVPTYFQAIMLPVDEVSDGFYENFKLGSSSLKNAVMLDISGTKYYFLYDRSLSRLVKKSGNTTKQKVAPVPAKPISRSTNQTPQPKSECYSSTQEVKPKPTYDYSSHQLQSKPVVKPAPRNFGERKIKLSSMFSLIGMGLFLIAQILFVSMNVSVDSFLGTISQPLSEYNSGYATWGVISLIVVIIAALIMVIVVAKKSPSFVRIILAVPMIGLDFINLISTSILISAISNDGYYSTTGVGVIIFEIFAMLPLVASIVMAGLAKKDGY